MILNTAIFTATIEAAKTAAANRPEVLRAIDRAVVEIERAAYWSFADGVLTIKSTTSGEMYKVDASHDCPAHSKTCKHNIARLLMIRYNERLAAAPKPPAIVIEQTERGYRFTLPYAPNAGALGGLKALVSGYHRRLEGEPYRTISADKLNAAIELLNYWFGEYQDGENRHGRPACAVVVAEMPAPVVADTRAATIARIEAAWEGKGYTVGRALFRRFGVNQLSMLPDQTLNQIAAAIK